MSNTTDAATKRSVSKTQVIGGTVIALALIGFASNLLGGGDDTAAPAPAAPAAIEQVVPAAPVAPVNPAAPAAPVAPAEPVAPVEQAPAPVKVPMPDVVGMNLQDAQDLIQESGVFFSRSEDATGAGRLQVIDSNWTVVAQTPAPGELIGEGDAVLSVTKNTD